jgi:hypothetical protein
MRVGEWETPADPSPAGRCSRYNGAWAASSLRAAAESAASHAVGFFLSRCSFPARAGGRTKGVCEVRSVLTLPWGVCWSCSSGILVTRRVDEGRVRGCLCGSWCESTEMEISC